MAKATPAQLEARRARERAANAERKSQGLPSTRVARRKGVAPEKAAAQRENELRKRKETRQWNALARRWAKVNTAEKVSRTVPNTRRFLQTMTFADATATIEDMEAGKRGRGNFYGAKGTRPVFVTPEFLARMNAASPADRAMYFYG